MSMQTAEPRREKAGRLPIEIHEEALELFRDLLRIDTTNPPATSGRPPSGVPLRWRRTASKSNSWRARRIAPTSSAAIGARESSHL